MISEKQKRYEQHRAWRLKNMERRREYKRNWNRTHKESVAISFKKSRAKHGHKWAVTQKAYALRNREKRRAYMKAYNKARYPKLREMIISQTAKYAKSHPEVRKRCRLNWIKKNPERYKSHVSAMHSKRKARMRGADVKCKEVSKLIRTWRHDFFFQCAWCGEIFPTSKLHVDHIVPVSKGGKHCHVNICRSCPACNISKGAKLDRVMNSHIPAHCWIFPLHNINNNMLADVKAALPEHCWVKKQDQI